MNLIQKYATWFGSSHRALNRKMQKRGYYLNWGISLLGDNLKLTVDTIPNNNQAQKRLLWEYKNLR